MILTNPITGIACCCPRSASRQAATARRVVPSQSTMPRFPSVFPYLVSGILARPASTAQFSNAALPSVGEVTFVGSAITLPQPEKVNEVDAEPSSS